MTAVMLQVQADADICWKKSESAEYLSSCLWSVDACDADSWLWPAAFSKINDLIPKDSWSLDQFA